MKLNFQKQRDLCTMYWPDISGLEKGSNPAYAADRFTTSKPDDVKDDQLTSFLVGWNPRGYVLCIVDVIRARHVEEVTKVLESTKGHVRATHALPSGLRVLGRFRPDSVAAAAVGKKPLSLGAARRKPASPKTPNSSAPFFANLHDDGSRNMKQVADIWVEMNVGPSIHQLFCCGIKCVPQTHIVRFDPKSSYHTTPDFKDVLSRVDLSGIKGTVYGQDTIRLVAKAQSALEGVVLHPHVLSLLGKGNQQQGGKKGNSGAGDVTNVSNLSITAANALNTGSTDTIECDSFDSLTQSPAKEHPNHGDGVDDSVLMDAADSEDGEQDVDADTLKANPPRLNFTSRSSSTELQATLDCVNAGIHIRNYFADWEKKQVQPQLQTDGVSDKQNKEGILTPLFDVMTFVVELILSIISNFLPYSYVLRLTDYRLRQWVNFLQLLGGRSDSCGLGPLIPYRWKDGCSSWQRRSCMAAFLGHIATDVFLGIFVAGILILYREPFLSSIHSVAWFGLYELHSTYLNWFLGWPAGFKMNEDLNRVLYAYTTTLLVWWKNLVTFNGDWDWLGTGFSAVLTISPLGFSFMLSVVADCCNVATLHLRNIFHTHALIYRGFVTVLDCLLKEFRGKKHNPLRNRVDMAEFAVDQVLIGTLVASATGFLFPTVTMYYLYFAIVRTSVWLVQEILTAVAYVSTALPTYELLQWILFRGHMPYGVTLSNPKIINADPQTPGPENMDDEQQLSSPTAVGPAATPLPIVELRLLINSMPFGMVFTELKVLTWIVFRPFSPSKIMSFILHAKDKPAVNADKNLFPHLVADCRNPPLTLAANIS